MNVVVSTFDGRWPWLADCLASIPLDWKVHTHNGWELDAIYESCDRFERFLFVQDSVIFDDPTQLALDLRAANKIDLTSVHLRDVALFPLGQSGYCGMYSARAVHAIPRPAVVDKAHAIALETQWVRAYHAAMRGGVLYPLANDAAGYIEHRHGRDNLVLDSGTVRKMKGTFVR